MKTGAIAIATVALITGSALAHGSAGGMGSGMGGGMGMPSQSMSRIPSGVPMGQPSTMPQSSPSRSSNSMGRSTSVRSDDSAHAGVMTDSDTNAHLRGDATLHAASDLGKLNADHASATAFEQASSRSAVGAIATYQNQMKAALALSDSAAQSAAITAARQQLASSTKVTLTSATASKIDADLGINGASPDLGTSP